MTDGMENMNPTKVEGRMAGFLYLIVAITGFYSFFLREKLTANGSAMVTAHGIVASEWIFRVGMVNTLVMVVSWILLAFALYRLFKPVNRSQSLYMVLFVLVGSAVTCNNALSQFAALVVLNGSSYLTVLSADQLQALAILFLNISEHGVLIAHIFFGLWLFPLGYVVFRSGYFPKAVGMILGTLLTVAGLGYIVDFFIFFLMPDADITITQFTFWGELFLLLWLLIKGVKVPVRAIQADKTGLSE